MTDRPTTGDVRQSLQMICLSDPARIRGEVFLDYGSYSPRMMMGVDAPHDHGKVVRRVFALLETLQPGYSDGAYKEARRHGFTVLLKLDAASEHDRIAARADLTDALVARGYDAKAALAIAEGEHPFGEE